VNLRMTWDRFFPLAIRPDIMLPAVAQEAPAKLTEGSLQVSSFHGKTVHGYVYSVKRSVS
jgi:hypothetical protein